MNSEEMRYAMRQIGVLYPDLLVKAFAVMEQEVHGLHDEQFIAAWARALELKSMGVTKGLHVLNTNFFDPGCDGYGNYDSEGCLQGTGFGGGLLVLIPRSGQVIVVKRDLQKFPLPGPHELRPLFYSGYRALEQYGLSVEDILYVVKYEYDDVGDDSEDREINYIAIYQAK